MKRERVTYIFKDGCLLETIETPTSDDISKIELDNFKKIHGDIVEVKRVVEDLKSTINRFCDLLNCNIGKRVTVWLSNGSCITGLIAKSTNKELPYTIQTMFFSMEFSSDMVRNIRLN